MRTELDIHKCYAQQSEVQIQSIEARYNAGVDFAKKLLDNNDLFWLDIGPNFGHGLKKLQLSHGQIVAVDIEQEYLQKALNQNRHVEGAVMDGCQLGFPDSCFNVVSFFEVIEHMGEAEQEKLLTEANRVLKPGGILLASTPNKIASGRRRMSPDHEKELTPQELTQLLTNSQFSIKQTLGEGFFNTNKVSHRLFRIARENPLAVFAYYKAIPLSLRKLLRNAFLVSQNAKQVREPTTDEIPRIIFAVCQKPSN